VHTTNTTIYKNILLAPYTTFKIGGVAKYFTKVKNASELLEVCSWAKNKNIDFFVLGGGSNVLFSDKGFDGLVIKFTPFTGLPTGQAGLSAGKAGENIHFFEGKGNLKIAEISAGTALSQTVLQSIKADLSGMEWAIGIPGTVGGAIYGNAGAFGKEIADSLKLVNVLDMNDLSIRQIDNIDCNFGYRNSVFKNNSNLIILSGIFIFQKEKPGFVKDVIVKNQKQRNGSFGSGKKCAGCFFKNIDWKRGDIDKKELLKEFPELKIFSDKPKISAGFLIDKMKLKGQQMGGAKVSKQHANFILNSGDARADQILMLSGFIKDKIYSHYGLALEEEVRLIGF